MIMQVAAAIMLLLLPAGALQVVAGEKFYIQSIKASDDAAPPGKDAKRIGPKLAQKLSPVFRWKYYWELERHEITLSVDEAKKVKLGSTLRLKLGPIVKGKVEIRLYRGKDLVRKSSHTVHDKMTAVLGGDDEKHSAWFIVVRREAPQYEIALQ